MLRFNETVEVRWFLQDQDSRAKQIMTWMNDSALREAGSKTGPEIRGDVYLVPALPIIGVKQRGGGALEVKLRLSAGQQPPVGTLAGRIEEWVKVQAGDQAALGTLAGHRWARVAKSRLLVKLDAATSKFVPQDTFVDAGCGIEVTRLIGWNQITLGLEAFAPDLKGAHQVFDLALQRVASALQGLALTEAESRGYPEWLSIAGA